MLAAVPALAATPPAERSVGAAVDVVRALYAALDRHDYARAHAIWSGGHGLAAYRAGYRHTAHVRVTPLPPFTSDAGMGHSWAEIRVRVDATLDSGRRQRFAGSYTLSRVNDVDGSTAAQRRWHIVAAKLRPVPAGA